MRPAHEVVGKACLASWTLLLACSGDAASSMDPLVPGETDPFAGQSPQGDPNPTAGGSSGAGPVAIGGAGQTGVDETRGGAGGGATTNIAAGTILAGWAQLDIGKEENRESDGARCPDPDAMLTPGEVSYEEGTWTLTGSGEGFIHGWDQGNLVYQAEPVQGDFTFSAKIESMEMLNPEARLDGAAEALINVRNDLNYRQPANSIITGFMPRSNIAMARFHWDVENKWWYYPAWPDTWPVSRELPVWARIQRRGNSFSTYTSNDGETWEPSVERDGNRDWYPFQLDDFGEDAFIGLVCSARNDRNLNPQRTSDGCHDPSAPHLTQSARCVFSNVTLTQP